VGPTVDASIGHVVENCMFKDRSAFSILVTALVFGCSAAEANEGALREADSGSVDTRSEQLKFPSLPSPTPAVSPFITTP
jgi:hypothetical protein